VADYRAHITGAIADRNDILLQVTVQMSTDGGANWDDVTERQMRLQHQRLDEVLDDATLTDPQKRQALAAIFRHEAAAWGFQAAHATLVKLEALITWPQNVSL
jgi:hypothetical protein